MGSLTAEQSDAQWGNPRGASATASLDDQRQKRTLEEGIEEGGQLRVPKARRLELGMCSNLTLMTSMRQEKMEPSLEAATSAEDKGRSVQEQEDQEMLISLDRVGREETRALSGLAAVSAMVTG